MSPLTETMHLQALRKRRNIPPSSDATEFDLIASLLPSPSASATDDDEDPETEDILRNSSLLLLRLIYGQAQSQLDSISQELDILRNAPPSPPQKQQDQKPNSENDVDWKLDRPVGGLGRADGPILDPQGKVGSVCPDLLFVRSYLMIMHISFLQSLCDPSPFCLQEPQTALGYKVKSSKQIIDCLQ